MALRKVQGGAIADNAITSDKIAAGAVSASDIATGAAVPAQTGNAGKYLKTDGTNSSWENVPTPTPTAVSDQANTSTGYFDVPAGTTAQRPVSPNVGMVRYNTDLGNLEQYTESGWGSIAPPPSVSSVSPTTYNGESGTTFTINGSGFGADASVKFITTQGAEYSAATVSRVSASQLTATTPQDFTIANEPLSVKVIQGSGTYQSTGLIDCGGVPTWNTTAGSLGNIYDGSRSLFYVDVSAGDPDENATVTYSIVSGSLPTGMSINSSTGRISGTTNSVGSDTTYNFTLAATDNAGNSTQRSFSLTVKAPIVQTFSYTGSDQTFTVPSSIYGIAVKMWGAGGGGSSGEGYSFAGGPGGYTYGLIDVTSFRGQNLIVKVGQGGPRSIDGSQPAAAWPNGGRSGRRSGYTNGYGGGRSEIKSSSIDLLVAGAGGGAAGTGGSSSNPTSGGPGGGTTGGYGWYGYQPDSSYAGQGGTQSAGGANGVAINTSFITYNPGYKQGGSTNNDQAFAAGPNCQGGGGDGYYGGGIGSPHAGGGGGSSYANATYVSNADLQRIRSSGAENSTNPPNTSDAQYNGSAGKTGNNSDGNHGYVVITY